MGFTRASIAAGYVPRLSYLYHRSCRDSTPQTGLMEKNNILIDLLAAIPEEATQATVMGITMQIISPEKRKKMLQDDPDDNFIHECILINGIFLFVIKEHRLIELYKVVQSE